jgi:hypothetical protein
MEAATLTPLKKLVIARLLYHVSGMLLGLTIFSVATFALANWSAW